VRVDFKKMFGTLKSIPADKHACSDAYLPYVDKFEFKLWALSAYGGCVSAPERCRRNDRWL